MPEDSSESDENKEKATEFLLSAHLNLALVYLKVAPPHYFEAMENATKALKFDADNVKGLFRLGQAMLGLGEAESAMKEFQKVVNAEPGNKVSIFDLSVFKVFRILYPKGAKWDPITKPKSVATRALRLQRQRSGEAP